MFSLNLIINVTVFFSIQTNTYSLILAESELFITKVFSSDDNCSNVLYFAVEQVCFCTNICLF